MKDPQPEQVKTAAPGGHHPGASQPCHHPRTSSQQGQGNPPQTCPSNHTTEQAAGGGHHTRTTYSPARPPHTAVHLLPHHHPGARYETRKGHHLRHIITARQAPQDKPRKKAPRRHESPPEKHHFTKCSFFCIIERKLFSRISDSKISKFSKTKKRQ